MLIKDIIGLGVQSPVQERAQNTQNSSDNSHELQHDSKQHHHHRLDKFGFIVNIDSRGRVVDVQSNSDEDSDIVDRSAGKVPTFAEYKQMKRREKKWGVMMGRWRLPDPEQNLISKKVLQNSTDWSSSRSSPSGGGSDSTNYAAGNKFAHRRKVITRLRKGVPDHMRGQVWQYLARVPQQMKQNPGLYQLLVKKAIQQHEEATQPYQPSMSDFKALNVKYFKNIQDTIERDIHRTYPRHHLFYESEPSLDDEDDERQENAYRRNGDRTNDHSNGTSSNGNGNLRSPSADGSASSDPSARQASLSAKPSESRGSPQDSSSKQSLSSRLQDPLPSPLDYDDVAVGNFCGNEDITNMIRELEGVVAGDGDIDNENGNLSSLPSLLDRDAAGRAARVADAAGGQASLRRVLKAYSVYDTEIGYCQGMNFVAGMFLTLMPEEESFWLLVYVMNDEPCRMRGLFGEGMRETHLVLFVAERLIHQYLPKVYKHLEKEHVHITMFATQWLLTQFTSSFRFDLVVRVWDAFLGEGWKMTYRVMLAVLKLKESIILRSSFEDILTLFRELPDNVTGNAVMDMAFQIPLQRRAIERYEYEWLEQQQEAARKQNQRGSLS